MEKNQTNNHPCQNEQTPNSQTIKRRIGNTTFTINIHFNGTETAEDKMLRLIKNALDKSA